MHIVKFKGGLGNQIFQLCLYRKLLDEYGAGNIYADISSYKMNDAHGGFKLDEFYELSYIDAADLECVRIDEINYDTVKPDPSVCYCYDGYWQNRRFMPLSLRFLDKIFNREFLTGSERQLADCMEGEESVSVHIRRGDYVNNHVHGDIANLTYIVNAVEHMKSVLCKPVFYVFSDDIPWCREHLKMVGTDFHYVTGNEDKAHMDIYMMSRCRHNIISNSSFSWWGQKLNTNTDKIVIAPEYWCNESRPYNDLNNPDFVHMRNVPSVSKTESEPYFSFILPVFNRECTIRRCLAGILNQTFANIEVIAVDDASTDGTFSVLEEYAGNDARINLMRNEVNSSALSSRIKAMNAAKGKYILFADSDDYYDHNTCAILKERLRRGSVDILEYAYVREPSKKVEINKSVYGDKVVEKILMGEWPHALWNRAYSAGLVKCVLEEIEDFYCNFTDDIYIAVLLFSLGKTYDRIKDVLYHYVDAVRINAVAVQTSAMISEENSESAPQPQSSDAGGMSTRDLLKRGSMNNTIVSLKNKELHLKKYIDMYDGSLMKAVQTACENDIRYAVRRITESGRTVDERIILLNMLDEGLGTHQAKQYENRIDNALEIYGNLNAVRRRDRIKYLLKQCVRVIKKGIRE